MNTALASNTKSSPIDRQTQAIMENRTEIAEFQVIVRKDGPDLLRVPANQNCRGLFFRGTYEQAIGFAADVRAGKIWEILPQK